MANQINRFLKKKPDINTQASRNKITWVLKLAGRVVWWDPDLWTAVLSLHALLEERDPRYVADGVDIPEFAEVKDTSDLQVLNEMYRILGELSDHDAEIRAIRIPVCTAKAKRNRLSRENRGGGSYSAFVPNSTSRSRYKDDSFLPPRSVG